MPFQSHSGETLPSEATALAAPVIRRVCAVFLVDVLSILLHFSRCHHESLMNLQNKRKCKHMHTNTVDRTIYAYRKFANVLGFGHLPENSWTFTISLERSQERRNISYVFLCYCVSLLRTAHVHMVSFRSMGSVDFLCDSSGSKAQFLQHLFEILQGTQRQTRRLSTWETKRSCSLWLNFFETLRVSEKLGYNYVNWGAVGNVQQAGSLDLAA